MVEVSRSLPHGHVAAVLGTIGELGLEELIDPARSRQRDRVTAMMTAAVIDGSSKLATARGLRAQTAASSLGAVLHLETCDEDGLYAAMAWLLPRQQQVETALAARHLREGTLVLYDVSSAAFEGRTCPLGEIGHARDGVPTPSVPGDREDQEEAVRLATRTSRRPPFSPSQNRADRVHTSSISGLDAVTGSSAKPHASSSAVHSPTWGSPSCWTATIPSPRWTMLRTSGNSNRSHRAAQSRCCE
jgi:hypothetical protein